MSSNVVITVRVTPRSNRDAIEASGADGALRVRVTAPPVDGAANRAVVKLMASALGVPKSTVSVLSGASGRNKRVLVEGIDSNLIPAGWPSVSVTRKARR